MKKLFKQKNMSRQTLSNSKGFTLVETLVSLSIFTTSILALLVILSGGISNTSYAKQKIVASYLAQEGIECVRNLRDTKVLYPPSGQTSQDIWNVFRENITPLDFSGLPSCSNSSLSRLIIKEKISDDEVKITSDVSWSQGSGTYHIIFLENLFNWIE